MKLAFDPRCNVAYIRLNEKTEEVETIHINEELSIDLALDSTIYGIEPLNENEQLMPTGNVESTLVQKNQPALCIRSCYNPKVFDTGYSTGD